MHADDSVAFEHLPQQRQLERLVVLG